MLCDCGLFLGTFTDIFFYLFAVPLGVIGRV